MKHRSGFEFNNCGTLTRFRFVENSTRGNSPAPSDENEARIGNSIYVRVCSSDAERPFVGNKFTFLLRVVNSKVVEEALRSRGDYSVFCLESVLRTRKRREETGCMFA